MAAVLDAGARAAASYRAAAALWQVPGFDLAALDVSRPHDDERHQPCLGRLHRTRLLPARHVTVVDGIPVTTPGRTLFDLAGMLPPARTERAVDNALAKSPGLLRTLHRMLPELAERGRNGITVMRALLDARPVGWIGPASGLEARAIRVLDEAGIRTRRQVDLGGDDWIGRVDLLVVGTNVVVEVDSARFHTSVLDRERDARRDAELVDAGYYVVRLTEEEVWHAPYIAVDRLRAVLEGGIDARTSIPPSKSAEVSGWGRVAV
jgi:very-short-patch-repair endonuclease